MAVFITHKGSLGVPGGLKGVPRASQGRDRESQGRPLVPCGPRGEQKISVSMIGLSVMVKPINQSPKLVQPHSQK